MRNLDKLSQFISEWWSLNKAYLQATISKSNVSRFEAENISYLHEEVLSRAEPLFVLSTGRAGTRFLFELLQKSAQTKVYHDVLPELRYHSEKAYVKGFSQCNEVSAMFDAARYELIRNAYIEDKKFCELNPGITFFAFQIAHLFPNAKFLHLHRHPLEFIESGVARKWYETGRVIEEGRIKAETDSLWKSLPNVEKIAFLWMQTNSFIEGVKERFPERFFTCSSTDIFNDESKLLEILHFGKVSDLSKGKIRSHMKKVVNSQDGKKELTDAEKERVWKKLGDYAKKYNYELK